MDTIENTALVCNAVEEGCDQPVVIILKTLPPVPDSDKEFCMCEWHFKDFCFEVVR